MNALTVIDEIIGSLSRGGPGREATFWTKTRELPTHIRECGSLLGIQEVKPTVWLLPGESAYDAFYLTRAVLEVLNDNLPRIGLLPLEDQFDLFLKTRNWPQEKFISFAKYFTAWPMARYLQNTLPRRPDGFPGNPLVFGGKIRRILKNRLVSFNDKNTALWLSFLQGVKRGAAPVTKNNVREAMLKHRERLSTVPLYDWFDLSEFEPYFARFYAAYKAPRPALFEASTSASFQAKRDEGGAREYLRRRYYETKHGEPLLHMVETRPGVVEEVRGLAVPPFSVVLADAAEAPTDVMVSAVLEPLKVRLISKGDSSRYWISKFVQKGLWKHLQRYPQFVLTGRPLLISDLHDLLDREERLGLSFDQWVSGDYSAATDGLNLHYTKMAFEASLAESKYEKDLKDVLRSVLYEQRLHYPDAMNPGDLDPVDQANGQLMGSILSFPILCAVNLVGYWISIEEYLGRRVKMKYLPVLINGDDILFRANNEFYQLWQYNIERLGFTLSLGKNYIHSSMLTINSQMYRYSAENKRFKQIGFLNTGLLTGQSKVTGRQNAKLAPIWALYNETVHSSAQPQRTHRRFLHYHKEAIARFTGRGEYNLFLPVERGGLGFMPPLGLKFKLTSFQRRYAGFMESYYRDQLEAGQVPSMDSVALVRESARPQIEFFHKPDLVLVHAVGPRQQHVEPYLPRMYKYPILSQGDPTETSVPIVRLPRRSKVRFKESTSRRLSTEEAMSWPWILAERRTDRVKLLMTSSQRSGK
jgi:hypothetical protein